MNFLGLAMGFVAGIGMEHLAVSRARRVPAESVVVDDDLAGVTHHHLPTKDGASLHVIEEGPANAPAVVFLHGVTLGCSIFHRQFVLAQDYRIFSLALRGHGESTSGETGPSIEAGATDLALLLQAFDLTKATIVGHSMGGMVLGHFLTSHGKVAAARVGAVGFMSTSARTPTRVPTSVLGVASGGLAKMVRSQPGLAGILDTVPPSDLGELSVRATFGRPARPDDVREVAGLFDAMDPTNILEIAPSLLAYDIVEDLRNNPTAASIIVGSRDPITPVDESELLRDLLPNADLTVVPDAGHQLMLERSDEVNDWVCELVERAQA